MGRCWHCCPERCGCRSPGDAQDEAGWALGSLSLLRGGGRQESRAGVGAGFAVNSLPIQPFNDSVIPQKVSFPGSARVPGVSAPRTPRGLHISPSLSWSPGCTEKTSVRFTQCWVLQAAPTCPQPHSRPLPSTLRALGYCHGITLQPPQL